MKINNIKPKSSVIIVNYNNSKYLLRSLESLKNQTSKNFEIILVDDNSSDNSIDIKKEFSLKNKIKNFKIVINKNRTKFGSLNQIKCIKKGLKIAKGEIIFFLDSDDFFKNSKLQKSIDFFKKNKKINLTFDLPYKFYNKNKKIKFKINKRSKKLIPWPSFPSQSCLIVKKKYLNKILKDITTKKYPNIWFDFRLVSKAFHDFGNIKFINEHLTFYQQHTSSESAKFKKFSKNWWKRRREAHQFLINKIFKNNKKIFSLDYYFTNLINLIL